jgi:hypothetical protein
MFRNLLSSLVGMPLLLPLVFAYLVAVVLAIASLASNGHQSADRSHPQPHHHPSVKT